MADGDDPLNLIPSSEAGLHRAASASASAIVKVQGNAQWNGRLGMVQSYNHHRDRYDVEICVVGRDVLFPCLVTIGVKPQNIDTIAPPTPWEVRKFHLLHFYTTSGRKFLPILLLLITYIVLTVYYHNNDYWWVTNVKEWSRQELYILGIILLIVLILLFGKPENPFLDGGPGNNGPLPPPSSSRYQRTTAVVRNNDPPPPHDSGGGISSFNPFRGNGWNWKKLLALMVGLFILSRLDPRTFSQKILEAMFVAYHTGYQHGNDDNNIPFRTLQQQYEMSNPKPPAGSLLDQFRPQDDDAAFADPDDNNARFIWAFRNGLEAFYQLGYEDGAAGNVNGASLPEYQTILLKEAGLLPYL